MYAIIFHIFQLISWDRSICMACVGHICCFTACKYIQYIPRNMNTVFALLCFVVVIHWLIFPYPSGLLHWHCGNLTIAPVPAKQPWWIWINTSCEFIMNDCITTTKQSTTKPCAYCLGYTVSVSPMQNQSQCGWFCLLLLPVTMPSGIPCDTIYPKKYAHGFVVLYLVVVMQSFIMNSHEVFIHIHQSCFAGIGAIVRLPQQSTAKQKPCAYFLGYTVASTWWRHQMETLSTLGEFIGHRWIPYTKASDEEFWCFLWPAPE